MPVQEDWSVAKKKNAAKRTVRKARRSATNSARKATRPKKTGKRGKANPKKGARRPASGRKAAAPARKTAASRVAANARRSGVAAFAPAGEVYGEESWKEEELSAVELESDAPERDELEAELERPEVTEETDDSEW
jgi:hypothetical protein